MWGHQISYDHVEYDICAVESLKIRYWASETRAPWPEISNTGNIHAEETLTTLLLRKMQSLSGVSKIGMTAYNRYTSHCALYKCPVEGCVITTIWHSTELKWICSAYNAWAHIRKHRVKSYVAYVGDVWGSRNLRARSMQLKRVLLVYRQRMIARFIHQIKKLWECIVPLGRKNRSSKLVSITAMEMRID